MKTEELDYCLPAELIAQQPLPGRSDSKLLVFERSGGGFADSTFGKIGEFLVNGDCLVLNDTKVLLARFFGERGSGGRLEALFLAESAAGVWDVMLKGARKVRAGEIIYLKDRSKKNFCEAEILDKAGEGRCRLGIKTDANVEAVLEKIGFPPLPPYIKRGGDTDQAEADKLRYQTVYARHSGAVAAPTAGLHFTERLMGQLKQAGVGFAYITLHTGAGTFKPVTADDLDEHEIHREQFSIDERNAQIINAAKEKGGRIIAVGTTSARTLETIAADSRVKAAAGTTNLFIKPGYKFRIIDAMITNFHLPRSTLLALVAAFAGLENVKAAYQHAIEQRYRFYSYGDAMLII
ncbi:MAG: tRNA preQ1(34) S-adenosylmethionine ribosyltransferase-isomerase QueA [Phycisphaerae bacterium]|nr:tRNA preQ1(34) S-adenosylmethionine ribosyltransferase-isomerase QueA [Phycisphaerae bacterium]